MGAGDVAGVPVETGLVGCAGLLRVGRGLTDGPGFTGEGFGRDAAGGELVVAGGVVKDGVVAEGSLPEVQPESSSM